MDENKTMDNEVIEEQAEPTPSVAEPVEEVTDDGAVEEKPDDTAVLEKMDAILGMVQSLQECFDDKIAQDAYKNELFDKMHRELTRYQNGAMDKIVDTVGLDIIQLVDSTEKHCAVYEQKEPNEENYKRLLRIVKGIAEDLQDILYRQNIESYSVDGTAVDVRRQKIIQTVPTGDPELDNCVADRKAKGYEKDGKVFRPERIVIYKYKPDEKAASEGNENE